MFGCNQVSLDSLCKLAHLRVPDLRMRCKLANMTGYQDRGPSCCRHSIPLLSTSPKSWGWWTIQCSLYKLGTGKQIHKMHFVWEHVGIFEWRHQINKNYTELLTWLIRELWKKIHNLIGLCLLVGLAPSGAKTSCKHSYDKALVLYDGVIKWKHFPRYWPFVREFTGQRWIPLTKASDAGLWYFLWSAPE